MAWPLLAVPATHKARHGYIVVGFYGECDLASPIRIIVLDVGVGALDFIPQTMI